MNIILSTKLKNGIEKQNQNLNLKYHLRNISINGVKKGCSGFIENVDNGKIIYITTEICGYVPLEKKTMFRFAENLKDYGGKGGFNQWVNTDELFPTLIKNLK